MLQPIEQAIFQANMGVTPQNDGEIIRIVLPMLTEERRRDLIKQASTLVENAKVSIRNARRDVMNEIKKAVKDGYSEDAGKNKEFKLKNLSLYLEVKEDLIDLSEFQLLTANNNIQGQASMKFQSFQKLIDQQSFDEVTASFPQFNLNAKDAFYFIPELRKDTLLSTFSDADLIGQLNIQGDEKKLNIAQTDLKWGKSTQLKIEGSVENFTDIEYLRFDLKQFKAKTNNNCKLLLAGRMAWQITEVIEAIAQAQYKTDIIRLNYVPDDALHQIVGAAHTLTYVSLFEGFGIPILEAMNCDVPSITSEVTSMPEVAGDAGILINPYDINTITDAMVKMTSSTNFRNNLIEKGRIQRQKYTWDLTAERLWRMIFSMKK